MAVITASKTVTKVISPSSAAGHQLLKPPPQYSSGGGGAVPVPLATVIKGGTTGVAYSETISAVGGTPPYTFTITSGALPTGLSMTSGGIISGTPTTVASFSFTVKATDATLSTGSTVFQITITAPSSGGGAFVFMS